jgi:hypothetical protein
MVVGSVARPKTPSPAFHPQLMLPRVMGGQKIHTRRVWGVAKQRYDVGEYYLREPVDIISIDGDLCTIEYRFDGDRREVPCQPERKNGKLTMPVVGKSRGRAPIPWEWSRYRFTVCHRWEHPLIEISDEDILKEGIEPIEQGLWRNYGSGKIQVPLDSPRCSFQSLWDALNAPGDRWLDNPVVQAIEFKISLLEGVSAEKEICTINR